MAEITADIIDMTYLKNQLKKLHFKAKNRL